MTEPVSPPGTGCLLPDAPAVSAEFQKRVTDSYDRFARTGLPESVEDYLLNEFSLDVATEYAGLRIRNPWGKASGQLSMNAGQVREDVEAGLGFVVLKTVIAEDATGQQSMEAWAVREARMQVERVTGRLTGRTGWTVTWKGRGWWQSFDEYLALIRDARRIAAEHQSNSVSTLIVPSCKYHLPARGEKSWKTAEYEYSTRRFLDAWKASPDDVMPIEKDFSPTLAGSDLAAAREPVLEWLHHVPALIRNGAGESAESLRVGLKIFNAMFADEFQLELLRLVHRAPPKNRPDFYVYGNRLFDPDREFDGKRGVACGGPDLSDRNLRVMSAFAREVSESSLPWSATGNIGTGKTAVEYALRGATSFQLHTFFQLPADQYCMKIGSRTQRALHELYFHPETGFVLWAEHLRRMSHHEGPFRIADMGCLADGVGPV